MKTKNIRIASNPSGFENKEVKIDIADVNLTPVVEEFARFEYTVASSGVLESFVDALFLELSFIQPDEAGFTALYGATKTETLEYFEELIRCRVLYVRKKCLGDSNDVQGIEQTLKFLAPAFIQQLISSVGIVELEEVGVTLVPAFSAQSLYKGEPFSADWLNFMTRMSNSMRRISHFIEIFEGPRQVQGNQDVLSFVWKSSKLYNEVSNVHPITVLLASMLETQNNEIFRPAMARVCYGDKSLFKHYASSARLVKHAKKDGN